MGLPSAFESSSTVDDEVLALTADTKATDIEDMVTFGKREKLVRNAPSPTGRQVVSVLRDA